jgi:hypothetical protein
MEGLDGVFFDVQDEVMEDVMSPMRTGGCSWAINSAAVLSLEPLNLLMECVLNFGLLSMHPVQPC